MISYATNIKSVVEELTRMPLQTLADMIRNPHTDTKLLLNKLRVVRQLNPTQYPVLKQQLPYFVCAMFTPQYRRLENFAYTEHFIVDIDHISEKGLVLSDLRDKMAADPRTALCFKSPSGDGLKVVMRLSERCHDAGLYKTFYKLFLQNFSRQYNIAQVVDTKTCDVTRACFVSEDADAYFCATPETVKMSDYINPAESVSMAFELKREADKAEKAAEKTAESQREKQHLVDPSKEVMDQIRRTLNKASLAERQNSNVYVPEILNQVMDGLRVFVEEKGVSLSEVKDIQYGKKLRFNVAGRKAEINLFYGKRGFSVVQSPRSGTDGEANQLMVDVIKCFLVESQLM